MHMPMCLTYVMVHRWGA